MSSVITCDSNPYVIPSQSWAMGIFWHVVGDGGEGSSDTWGMHWNGMDDGLYQAFWWSSQGGHSSCGLGWHEDQSIWKWLVCSLCIGHWHNKIKVLCASLYAARCNFGKKKKDKKIWLESTRSYNQVKVVTPTGMAQSVQSNPRKVAA